MNKFPWKSQIHHFSRLPVFTVFGPPSTTMRTTGTGSVYRKKLIVEKQKFNLILT